MEVIIDLTNDTQHAASNNNNNNNNGSNQKKRKQAILKHKEENNNNEQPKRKQKKQVHQQEQAQKQEGKQEEGKEEEEVKEVKEVKGGGDKVVEEVNEIALEDGGLVKYCKQFLTQKAADDMFEELLALTNWKQGSINMYGKVVKTPRLQSWMADPNLSGVSLYQKQPQLPWSPSVWELKTRIEKLIGCRFDYVLLNMYRDGNDYIGWHADREAIPKGKNVVASVSLGATRRFLFKHTKRENEVPKHEFSLTSGSLIVMQEETQRHWKHTVPKEPAVKNARINLTFRIN